MAGRLDAEVGAQLGVDVGERRWDADTALHREAQPVGLARPVVRILAEDQHACPGVRRQVQGGEDLIVRWVHRVAPALLGDECLEVLPVRLVELAAQDRVPIRRHDPVA